MELYQELLLDHYRHPRHKGHLVNPHFTSGEYNPSCGDKVCFEGKIVNDIVVEIAFDGVGCVISQATASLVAECAKNRSIEQLLVMTADDITQLIGMPLGPTRLKCALLALYALQQGLRSTCKQ